MLTLRENAMAIYNRQQPDFYGDLMEALTMIFDPMFMRDRCPQDGLEHKDSWGTTCMFKPGTPGKHPHITEENKVIKDIEHWRDYVTAPPIKGLDWSAAEAQAKEADRHEKMVCVPCACGLFERSHFLMGMENALVSYMEYPDEMAELLRYIADWKIEAIHEFGKHLHPDIIFYHDDWGSKQNVFLPPYIWREIIKPLQKEISDAIHEEGMIYMHHADCICQPIVTDMVDIGIDIWQGVIAQNDIVEIQRITEGKLAMIGGIDGPAIDIQGISEEAIRAEVRRAIDTYCPAGRFYPSIPSGICFIKRNDDIVKDELKNYGREWALKHPVK